VLIKYCVLYLFSVYLAFSRIICLIYLNHYFDLERYMCIACVQHIVKKPDTTKVCYGGGSVEALDNIWKNINTHAQNSPANQSNQIVLPRCLS
jgi:hypothetical protein